MVTYAVINKETLHVESTYGEVLKEALLLDFPLETHVHMPIPNELNIHTLKAVKNGDTIVMLNDTEKLFDKLRSERNILLDKTDKYVATDYPHPTPEAKQAWLDYRQALRDLPSNIEDPTDPVWPIPPT